MPNIHINLTVKKHLYLLPLYIQRGCLDGHFMRQQYIVVFNIYHPTVYLLYIYIGYIY